MFTGLTRETVVHRVILKLQGSHAHHSIENGARKPLSIFMAYSEQYGTSSLQKTMP